MSSDDRESTSSYDISDVEMVSSSDIYENEARARANQTSESVSGNGVSVNTDAIPMQHLTRSIKDEIHDSDSPSIGSKGSLLSKITHLLSLLDQNIRQVQTLTDVYRYAELEKALEQERSHEADGMVNIHKPVSGGLLSGLLRRTHLQPSS